MAGIVPQMFVASAAGLALAIGFIRGLARSESPTLGNFWVDLVRAVLYVMLPISVIGALLFVWQGVPQNFHAYASVTSPEGFRQVVTGGPMASQTIIELLGGNGGGFVGANAASPNENPTALCNFFQLLVMLLIPAALTNTFGRMVGDVRQGWLIFAAMAALLVGGTYFAQTSESHGNPAITVPGISGANWEGKEARFGPSSAGLSVAVATDTGNGAANVTYDSLMPVADLVALADMQSSEVIFGGVGSGLYGMLVYAIITVFIAGLMVGRTPEYLGKRIGRREVQFAMLAVLAFAFAVLVPAAVASVTKAGISVLGNDGAHGFSEIIYAFTSTAANNGSSMAGLGSNLFYNLATSVVMLIGRFGVAIPTMALAGALAAQPKNVRLSRGTFRTDTFMFGALLLGVVILVGALTFLPADLLGPIVEQTTLR
jgi:K+-transporting ATPase ATPase A chain